MKSYRKQHQHHNRLLKEEIQEVIKRKKNLCKEAKDILLFGAKHGFATRPKETDIIVIVESM